ncbi:kinase-like domain-containing protein [Mariannaea sp. PMI_226]|nr:kinase-like domain-containing protein [Mariannaea sp. PMI_226]
MLRSATCRPIRYCRSIGLVSNNQEAVAGCKVARQRSSAPLLFSRPFILSRFARLYKSQFPKIESLPLEAPIDEENIPGYKWETYYHPDPGEVLYGRYELKVKIGYGSSSTVWLAVDLTSTSPGARKPRKYVAIKINANNYEGDDAWHELGICHHITTRKPKNPWKEAHPALLTAIDHFIIPTSRGSHLCMVFDPMREPLWAFKRRLSDSGTVTQNCLPILKRHLQTILAGLEYLHSECGIIHTDLKADNILMTFEDHSVLEDFVQTHSSKTAARKIFRGRAVYQSQNNFGDVKDRAAFLEMSPRLADFGLAHDGSLSGPFINPIQPDGYHAPEVLLGTGWTYSADIWNFAILVWDLLTGRTLFCNNQQAGEPYSAARHIAEMIGVLGPVPDALLSKEKKMRHWTWMPEALNGQGKLCNTVVDYFGGPFFSDDGMFLHQELVAKARRWEDEAPECIPEHERAMFFQFMRKMLQWQPEARPKAAELMNDPWLNTNVARDISIQES